MCRRWESNPHGRKAHYALNVARLPVPPLRPGGYFNPKRAIVNLRGLGPDMVERKNIDMVK